VKHWGTLLYSKNRLSSRVEIQTHLNAGGIIKEITTTVYDRYLEIFGVE
jgi:hypothetical protein